MDIIIERPNSQNRGYRPGIPNEPIHAIGGDSLGIPIESSGTWTHPVYLHAVRDVIVSASRLNEHERAKVLEAELLYGVGEPFAYGICYYDHWRNERERTHAVMEIAAFTEESLEQLWETVAHESAHVVAGPGAGHGSAWKAAGKLLGLRNPVAAGPAGIEHLEPTLMALLRQIPVPQDGRPVRRAVSVVRPAAVSGSVCPVGIGTHGGTSRGPGSGSRLRLYVCKCTDPKVRVRIASDDFRALCLRCNAEFKRG